MQLDTSAKSYAPLRACAVAKDIYAFPQLVEQMNVELGNRWQILTPDEASDYLTSPQEGLEFFIVALGSADEDELPVFCEIVRSARDLGRRVILVASGIGPLALHELLLQGAGGFVPYPLPSGALSAAIRRAVKAAAMGRGDAAENVDRQGVVLPVHGMSGGAGASTFAVNLAWELASVKTPTPPKVCLLDLDVQFGSVSTYLDLPRQESIFELLTEHGWMDSDAFLQFLLTYRDGLSVLTAPKEIMPLDLVTPEDVARLIETARSNFDFVVIDLPHTVTHWTEVLLKAADVYFSLLQIDLRSVQNTQKFLNALKTEDQPVEKVRFILNRAPSGGLFGGGGRVRRLTESLDISLEAQLPDDGDRVAQSSDSGVPLAQSAARRPLRKEIARLAARIHATRAAKTAAKA